MAGDYSKRRSLNQVKQYNAVFKQQGRVDLDSDWNEQIDIQHYRTETETTDVIGKTGVPKNTTGFLISASTTGSGIAIAPGRIYIDGLLCELEQPASYFQQPYHPAPDALYFSGLPASSPASPDQRPLLDGNYIVYLDAWQREINYLDDPLIHEVALGEADTTTRQQTVWQVRLLKVTSAGGCQTAFPEWNQLIAPVTGQLNVQTKQTTDPKDPCKLPPTTGFRRLENQLYRIEIQKGGSRSQSTFKWSRDNASVEALIKPPAGSAPDSKKITVSSLGKDDVLGFATGQWVELVDEIATMTQQPNALVQITDIAPEKLEITLSDDVSALASRPNRKLRRWDQLAPEVLMNTLDGNWIDLEDGIQVTFLDGTYRAGDYWTFTGRTAIGDVEWVQSASAGPLPQLPAGTRHHYSRLAFIAVTSGVATVTDCRKPFPALTEITAGDVLFDNTNCQLPQARTVQEAIDLLCRNRQSSCTLTVIPGPDWESIFDQIADGQDAQICFQVGEFPLTKPAKLARKGHLKLNGSGLGTRIIARKLEAGLIFDNCKSVLIRDIYVETDHQTEKTTDLNGALTFLNCPSVAVEQVSLKCGAGLIRTATCLTVSNSEKQPGTVRVQNCDLLVGHQQQGILLINVLTASVLNNTLHTYSTLLSQDTARLLENNQQRAAVRRWLIDKAVVNSAAPKNTNTEILIGNQRVNFLTPAPLKKIWSTLLTEHPPKPEATGKEILTHLIKLSDRLLRDEAFRRTVPVVDELVKSISLQSQDTAAQGITIGGRIANDVRILNNTIDGSLQGVHIGQSHKQARQQEPDQAENVVIAGNTISIVLSTLAIKQDRHGIFVGNCKSLVIENNNIRLKRLPQSDAFPIDGIRVWGHLGDRVMVTKNYVASVAGDNSSSFLIGINVNPLDRKPDFAQWVVMWNVAPSRLTPIRTVNGAVNLAGTNAP